MGHDSEPVVGKAAPTETGDLLAMILDDFVKSAIDFTIDGHSVTRASFKSVSQALADGRIPVYFWKSAGGQGGTYDTFNLAKYEIARNRFVVPKKLNMYSYDVVVHESVHAGFDLAAEQKLQKLTDESCAYVAQMLHKRGLDPAYDKAKPEEIGADLEPKSGATIRAAWSVAGHIRKTGSGAAIPAALIDALKSAIKADTIYPDWAVQMVYDGVPEKSKPKPAKPAPHPGPRKRGHDQHAFNFGAVSPAHEYSFRTPGIYGTGQA
jgi:hypothetical protein